MRRREEKRRCGAPGMSAAGVPPLERAQLAAAAEARAAARPVVAAVYLFGSRAHGRAHPGSDVDVAVLTEPRAPLAERVSTQTEMARFLEERLQVPMDVVLIHPDLAPGLLLDIFSVETILFARDRAQAQRAAGQARNECRDLLPRLERAIAPGIVSVGLAKRQWDTDPSYRARAQKAIPFGHKQPLESVGNALLFLCSPAADHKTGAVLLVDGGCSLYPMD